jgi:hypothetical protein
MAQKREVGGYLLFGMLRLQVGLGLRFPDDDDGQRCIESVNVRNKATDPVGLLGPERG